MFERIVMEEALEIIGKLRNLDKQSNDKILEAMANHIELRLKLIETMVNGKIRRADLLSKIPECGNLEELRDDVVSPILKSLGSEKILLTEFSENINDAYDVAKKHADEKILIEVTKVLRLIEDKHLIESLIADASELENEYLKLLTIK